MQWFLNLSTKAKIVCCFCLMFTLIIIVIWTAYVGITATTRSQQELFQKNYKASLDIVEQRADQNRMRAQLLAMMTTSDGSRQQVLERDIRQHFEDINSNLKDLAVAQKDDQTFMAGLQEIVALWEEYRKTCEEQIGLIHGGKNEIARQLSMGPQEVRYSKIREIAIKLQEHDAELAKQRLVQTEQRTRKSLVIFLLAGLAAVFISTAMTMVMNKAISNPLTELSGIAERIAAGELDVSVPSSSRTDEVGILIQMFRRMVDNIKGYAQISRQIAAGDLSVTVTPQSEKDVMGNALAAMGSSLREMTREIIDGVNVLAASSSEISASTSQVVSGASETSVAVNETTSTVEEVNRPAWSPARRPASFPTYPRKRSRWPWSGGVRLMSHSPGWGESRNRWRPSPRASCGLPNRARPSARSLPRSTISPNSQTCWR